jgi:hypothetical protein
MVLTVVFAALLAQAPPAITPARQALLSPHRTTTSAIVQKRLNRTWRDAFAAGSQPTARTKPVRVVHEPAVHEQMGSFERHARVGMILYTGRFDRSDLALAPPIPTPSGRGQ